MNVPQGVPFPTASLYVGDLHQDVTEAMLYDKFTPLGTVVSLRICRDSRTRQSLGYGYVNFSQPADAERALDTMNFDLLRGKPMRIMWCQRDPCLRKSGIGNVFIKNLDKNIDNKAMYDTFSAFGNILSCKVALDENGVSKGYGFVHFEREVDAKNSIEKVNSMLLNGKKVYCGKFIPKVEREKLLGEKAKLFTNVYVKNFPKTLTNEEFYNLFSKFGSITSHLIVRKPDGTSKGFGFVAFEDPKAAQKAVEEMNDFEIEPGFHLYAGRAQKKTERMNELKRRYEQLKLERYHRFQGINLYVKNLDDSFDDEKLRQEFSPYGTITSAKVMQEAGRSKGFGFVCFTSPDEATKAVTEMNGRLVGNKPLYVALAQRKEERRSILNTQYIQRIRQPGGMNFPTANSPFLIPAMAQGPRFYNHINHIRPAPRWPTQAPLRPNGYNLSIMSNPPFRSNSRPSIQVNNVRNANLHARPIMGQQTLPARPNSKYSTNSPNNNNLRPGNLTYGNGGDNAPVSAPVINAAALATVSPQEQKQILGEHLYKRVHKSYPDLAGKITGMLLEIDNSELLHILENRDSLNAKMEEAIAVLQAHQGQATANKRLVIQD